MRNLQTKILTVILLILIAVIAIYFFTRDSQYEFTAENLLDVQHTDTYQANNNSIIIHVSGEVNNPGIVTLPYGSRIINAIESCGGVTLNADTSKINLAYVLRRWAKNIYTKYI